MVVALAAGFTVVLAAPAAKAQSKGIVTHTTLTTESRQINGHAVTAYSATIAADDGSAATGVVMLEENGKSLAGAALNSNGKADILVAGLTAGDHNLQAVYSGDTTHAASRSDSLAVSSAVSADSFALSINPTSVTVAAPGDAASVVATITPGSSFTGFVSMSCAGAPVSAGSSTDSAIPYGVSCTFTPENLEITSSTTAGTSDFTVQTTAPAGANGWNRRPDGPKGPDGGSPLVLAVLLPGVIGLGLLGRKRRIFGRVALVLAVGAISILGATACNARYKYLNHPPTANDGTLPGSYTLTIWAQTSNGVTASEQFTTLPLTVN
jgi:hypothetical protein